MRKTVFSILALCSVLALSSCGGGGDDPDVKPGSEILNVDQVPLLDAGTDNGTVTATVRVEANCNWTVTVNRPSDWSDLKVSPESGTKDTKSITITTPANPNYQNRKATLTFRSASGTINRTVNVEQSRGGEQLSVDNELSFTSDGGSQTFTITSNSSWTILEPSYTEGGSGWLSFTPGTGNGNATVTVTASDNPGATARKATLTVKSETLSRTVSITQEAKDLQLSVSVEALQFNPEGDKRSFTITSNVSWQIDISYTEGDSEWLSCQQSGKDNQTVEVTASEIQTDVERKATIIVTSSEVATTCKINVTQTGKTNITLALEQYGSEVSRLAFPATGGASQQVDVKSNGAWVVNIVTDDSDWLTLSAASGVGNGEVNLTCQPNTGTENRSATVSFMAGSKTYKYLTVNQQAAQLPAVSEFAQTGSGTTVVSRATFSFGYQSDFAVTRYGLCYSTTNSRPTTADETVVVEGSQTSASGVSVTASNLSPRTTYYVRAFAVSEVGTGYSDNVITITTQGNSPASDDNPYPQLSRKK